MSAFDTYKNAVLGVPYDPNKKPSRQGTVAAFSEMQKQLEAAQAGALVKDTLANLQALTAVSEASIMAWVVGDSVQANNGIYENTGTAGTPSWTRRVDIPQFVISGTNSGSGTANAIEIATDLPVPVENGRAMIIVPIYENNTGNVTVSINGGSPLSVLTNSGGEVPLDGLVASMYVAGFISGSTFRLMSDIASMAIQVAAANSAAAAALYAGPKIDDVATLIADTTLTYSAGQPETVAAGDYVSTRKENFVYEVAASGASDHNITTAGGVKLYVVLTEMQNYRAFGSNTAAINSAIVAVSANGGGSVAILENTTTTLEILMQDNVRLFIPENVTLTLDAALGGGSAINIDDSANSGVYGGGCVSVQGNATFGIRAFGATGRIDLDVRIKGWKYGCYLASADTVALGKITDGSKVILEAPHTADVVYPFQMTNRPSAGGPFCEGLEGALTVICRDATAGEYSASNAQTADQITLQGVNGNGGTLFAYSRNGGEVGITLSRGTNNLTLIGRATASDGHGVAVGSSHYPVDVADASGFSVGNSVTATINAVAVTATVEGKNGNRLFLTGVSGNENYAVGATLTNVTTGLGPSAITAVYMTRDINIVGFNANNNGLDFAVAGTNYAGLFLQRAQNIGLVGCSARGQKTGLLSSQSTHWHMGCNFSGNVTASVTLQGVSRNLTGLSDDYTGVGVGPLLTLNSDGRLRMGVSQLSTPSSVSGNSTVNNGVTLDTNGRMAAVANAASAIKANRTGTAGTKIGLVVEAFIDGVTTGGGVGVNASGATFHYTATVYDSAGTGTPEGVVTAGIGSTFRRLDGGAGTSFYVKQSGTGNTGWIGK